MGDLIVGFGLVLVFEGLVWAAFPHLALRLLQAAAGTPETQLRIVGLLTLVLGFLMVWLVRG